MPVSIIGNSGIQFPDNSLQTAAASPFGLKNRIINGDMRIDQRNAGASITTLAGTVAYTLDRWNYFATQASKFTIQRNAGAVTPPTGFTNYLGVTSSSAYSVGTAETFLISQIIEGFNVADLGWGTANAQTITISFWVRSSLTGTFGAGLHNGDVNRSYVFSYAISAANTWEYKTVTVAGDTTGNWNTTNGSGITLRFGLGSGSTFTTTAGSWQAGNFVQPTGTVSVVGTNGATFYITGVQLELGTTATPFERRMYGQELALCQRYYEVGLARNAIMWSGQTAASAAVFYGNKGFSVVKRASPTIATSNETLSGFASGTPSLSIDTTGFQANRTSSGSAVVSAYWFYNWTADAEL